MFSVKKKSESRRARVDLLTFIESADPSYPRLGVFTAVINKKNQKCGVVLLNK
jgi:hypothetical protein